MAGTSEATQRANQAALAKSTRYLADALDAIGVGGKDGLSDVGVLVTNRVKRNLSQKGTGRVYRRGRVLHQASAPGRPPAVDTGRLRSSYTWRTGEDPVGPYVEVGTNVEYAPWLEFGTVKMRPRPHLRPAIEELRGEIRDLIAQGIVREQRRRIGRMPKEIAA